MDAAVDVRCRVTELVVTGNAEVDQHSKQVYGREPNMLNAFTKIPSESRRSSSDSNEIRSGVSRVTSRKACQPMVPLSRRLHQTMRGQ